MAKYNIEGGLDFYSELYANLDQPDDDDANDKNVCLFSCAYNKLMENKRT